jgi:SnoaL-like domain
VSRPISGAARARTGGAAARALRRLEARAEILDLKARYAAHADAKYLPSHQRASSAAIERAARGQAECFTRDALWHASTEFGGDLSGREALFRFFCRAPWRFAMHFYVAPELTIEDDRAVGRWRLLQIAIAEGSSAPMLLGGVTTEQYRREDDRWLIAQMSFEQLHAVTLEAAVPELRCLIPAAFGTAS